METERTREGDSENLNIKKERFALPFSSSQGQVHAKGSEQQRRREGIKRCDERSAEKRKKRASKDERV